MLGVRLFRGRGRGRGRIRVRGHPPGSGISLYPEPLSPEANMMLMPLGQGECEACQRYVIKMSALRAASPVAWTPAQS